MHMQSDTGKSSFQLKARHGVERVNSHVHLHVPAACALYDAPEDGCILHPEHVEQGKCNKVTLNNLHQAGLNKPIIFNTSSTHYMEEKKFQSTL